MESKNRT